MIGKPAQAYAHGAAATDVVFALDSARFIGRAPEQVDEFLAEIVAPIRQRYSEALKSTADVHV